MFNQAIVEDDIFLDMPATSQNLYFHLCMNADDDGFVSPRKIMRMCSASLDDLNVLVARRYVLVFDNGVAVIKHWTVNNTIKKDRYIKTTYQKEYKNLTFNEWGVYTEKKRSQTNLLDVNTFTTLNSGQDSSKQENGAQSDPQYSIDKVSIDKYSTTNVVPIVVAKNSSQKIDSVFGYWKDQVGYEITSKIKQNRLYVGKLLSEYSRDDLAKMIQAAGLASENQYAPGISNFIDLYRKWDALKLWGKKQSTKKNNVEVIS